MGDWCGSIIIDSADIIEAAGAEEGKTANLSFKQKWGQAKKVIFFARGGVFSLDPPFNGRPQLHENAV